MNEISKLSGHTSGPWSFDGDWHRIPTIFGADGRKVASVEKDKREATPERAANAQLISAAPDLDEAASDAWKALMWIQHYDSADGIIASAIENLERARKKAGTFDYAAMRTEVTRQNSPSESSTG